MSRESVSSHTAQFKAKQPQDEMTHKKGIFNFPSNLTGPEIQKPKEQRVDMGEFTEVKTDSVSVASSSVGLSASLIAYFTYSCQKMSSQVKYSIVIVIV